MSKRAIILVLFAALVAAGCGITPGSKALEKSQERQADQVKAEGGEPATSTSTTKTKTTTETTKQPATGTKAAAGLTGAALADARSKFSTTCGGCHTLGDAKTSGSVGPNLDDLKPSADTVSSQIANGGGGMPAGLLSGDDADAVAAYVAQVAGNASP